MKPSLCGRADLLRAMASQHHDQSPSSTASIAALFSYRELPEVRRERSVPSVTPGARPDRSPASAAGQASTMADVPFWRVETCEALSLGTDEPPRSTPAPVTWRGRPETLPKWSPLAPKRVLLTRLPARATGDQRHFTL